VPAGLRATDTIYGGYLMLAPVQTSSSVSVAAAKVPRVRASGSSSSTSALAEQPRKLVPLSVPYQGSSKDFSVVTGRDALALFVPPLHEVDAESAKALSSKPSLFLCNMDGGKCNYTPGTITALPAANKGFRIASTLLRPVQDVKIQVGVGGWLAGCTHTHTHTHRVACQRESGAARGAFAHTPAMCVRSCTRRCGAPTASSTWARRPARALAARPLRCGAHT
jgi:hypothetical protein